MTYITVSHSFLLNGQIIQYINYNLKHDSPFQTVRIAFCFWKIIYQTSVEDIHKMQNFSLLFTL